MTVLRKEAEWVGEKRQRYNSLKIYLLGISMYVGLILKESLKYVDILEDKDIRVSRIENWELGDRAADFQPNIWTAIFIEGIEENIEQVAKKISKAILPKWYANLSDNSTEFVIFHNKIFKHKKGNKEDAKEAIEYGKSIGIPEHQLDWM